jgi:Mg/Co/Ni transporter MgtE
MMKWSTTTASALFLATAVPLLAGIFDNAGVALACPAPVVRILNCNLVKTSFKGEPDQSLR